MITCEWKDRTPLDQRISQGMWIQCWNEDNESYECNRESCPLGIDLTPADKEQQ